MYSSLEIWPTSTNPATSIPVIIEHFPFENYYYTIAYTDQPEACPYCKRYIDKHITHEGDNKYKCNWCSKTFKSQNQQTIEKQIIDSQYDHSSFSSCSSFSSFPLKCNSPQSMLTCSMIYKQILGSHYSDHRPNNFRQHNSDNPSNSLPYCYNLFFVIDCCVLPEKLEILKEYLLIAIESLKPNQSFILSVIHKNYISYVFALEEEQENDKKDESTNIFSFNFSYKKDLEQKIFQLIDLRKPANFVSHFEPLKKYINSIKSDLDTENSVGFSAIPVTPRNSNEQQETKNPVDYFVEQLIGDDHLFSEIVLFSTNGPKIATKKQIFIDWITPDSNMKSKPLIDGYFISSSIPNPKEQIKFMIQTISQNPVIFNVEVNAYVTNYRFIQTTNPTSQFSPFSAVSLISSTNFQSLTPSTTSPLISLVSQCSSSYSTAHSNFSVSYQLFSSTKFTNAFNLFSPSYLGIETTYIKFFQNNVFKETIWTSRVFKKSSDFIPTITTLNPYLLIPYLCNESAFKIHSEQTQKMSNLDQRSKTLANISSMKIDMNSNQSLVETFVLSLIRNYRSFCIVSIPGKYDDFTFSTIPKLQWFLRIVFEHLVDYHDIMHLCNIKNINYSKSGSINDIDALVSGDDDDDDMDFIDLINTNVFENHKKFLFNSIFPISCSLNEKFARYYPSISLWNDENNLMIDNCPLDSTFYESAGSPPIVIIDTVVVLFIFTENFQEIDANLNAYIRSKNHKIVENNSSLNVFISDKIDKRFPKTIISPQPLTKLYKLFPEKNRLFSCIKYYVKNNLLHKYD